MDNKITVYDLIKQRKFDEALILSNEECESTQNQFSLANRGYIFLCLKDYTNALNNYLNLISFRKHSSSGDFIYSGISYWFLNQPIEAIDIWKRGLKAQYTDAAGGVTIPAILYFSSIILNDEKLQNEAIKLLKKKWKSPSVINWPGAIAGYLLDEIDETSVFNSLSKNPILRERHLCQFNFYKAVKFMRNKDKMGYMTYLAESMSHQAYLEAEHYLSEGEWDKNRNYKANVDDFLNSL